MRVIRGHNGDPRPGHIHNLGQGSYAHHARFQFFTDARCLGTANTSAGHREYVSVRIRVGFAGGRIEREIRPLNKVATPPAFNLLRLLAGWSSTPLVQFLQEPASGLANRFQSFRGALAHVEQRIREGFKDVGKWFGVLGNV